MLNSAWGVLIVLPCWATRNKGPFQKHVDIAKVWILHKIEQLRYAWHIASRQGISGTFSLRYQAPKLMVELGTSEPRFGVYTTDNSICASGEVKIPAMARPRPRHPKTPTRCSRTGHCAHCGSESKCSCTPICWPDVACLWPRRRPTPFTE